MACALFSIEADDSKNDMSVKAVNHKQRWLANLPQIQSVFLSLTLSAATRLELNCARLLIHDFKHLGSVYMC